MPECETRKPNGTTDRQQMYVMGVSSVSLLGHFVLSAAAPMDVHTSSAKGERLSGQFNSNQVKLQFSLHERDAIDVIH
ncbi:hypothetical protein OUZ56_030947 [Daphnia magna]|uniref:Uncharacterized protein n=1 Tax=Daphnia magna TaxID=35525 RepID=A0ABQ9ZT55_9CRUS|nr:hypothetical protein OUZ56_030947 [Daphnia magna]